jgi:hypothetical protein
MAEIFEIKNYQYYYFSSRDSGYKAVAICKGLAGQTVYVNFMDGTGTLPEARKLDNNQFSLYYLFSDMPNIIDMLRNEKPIHLIYVPEGQNNTRLSTEPEPVGEGEEH